MSIIQVAISPTGAIAAHYNDKPPPTGTDPQNGSDPRQGGDVGK